MQDWFQIFFLRLINTIKVVLLVTPLMSSSAKCLNSVFPLPSPAHMHMTEHILTHSHSLTYSTCTDNTDHSQGYCKKWNWILVMKPLGKLQCALNAGLYLLCTMDGRSCTPYVFRRLLNTLGLLLHLLLKIWMSVFLLVRIPTILTILNFHYKKLYSYVGTGIKL